MGIWNLYFILKLVLLWAGIIGFHVVPNFIFAVLLAIRLRPRWARILRQVIAVPVGAGLLYYDSNLPPFARFIEQLPALLQFRFSYIIELLGRFVSTRDWLLLAILVLAYWIVNRWVRVTTFVLLALLIVPGCCVWARWCRWRRSSPRRAVPRRWAQVPRPAGEPPVPPVAVQTTW